MSDDSAIQWTDATWNPVRGCSRVSPGCENCYAERHGARFAGPGLRYEGFVRIGENGPRWTGRVELVPGMLDKPLRWRRPRRIFVNSLSDLFHEALSDEDIAAVFGVMAAAPQHTFQVLTKRAERMRAWFKSRGGPGWGPIPQACTWPLPNVHLGVSVEDQQRADERIPLLLETPAAVRYVSYEPALAGVDFARHLESFATCSECTGAERRTGIDEDGCCASCGVDAKLHYGIDWLIVGGESGPSARPFDIAWARSAIAQCRAAGVACFVKQLGAYPVDNERASEVTIARDRIHMTRDPKGGDPAEWPEDLRVREFPRAITPTTGDEHGNDQPKTAGPAIAR